MVHARWFRRLAPGETAEHERQGPHHQRPPARGGRARGTSTRSAGRTRRTSVARSTTARPPAARRPPRPSRMPKTLGLIADPVVVAETAERTGPDVAARLRG